LVPRSRGKNILKAATLTAIGQKFNPDLLTETLHNFGVTGSIWPQTGKIISIEGIEDARNISGIEEIFLRYSVGDTITPYIDCASRVIFIIATGSTLQKANQSLNLAKELIKIETI